MTVARSARQAKADAKAARKAEKAAAKAAAKAGAVDEAAIDREVEADSRVVESVAQVCCSARGGDGGGGGGGGVEPRARLIEPTALAPSEAQRGARDDDDTP